LGSLGDLYEQAYTKGWALGKIILSDWEDLYVFMTSREPADDKVILVYASRFPNEVYLLEKMRALTLKDLISQGSLLKEQPLEKEQLRKECELLSELLIRIGQLPNIEEVLKELFDAIVIKLGLLCTISW